MTVKAAAKAVVETKVEEDKPVKKWTLEASVFKPRKKEAASRDFYDSYATSTMAQGSDHACTAVCSNTLRRHSS